MSTFQHILLIFGFLLVFGLFILFLGPIFGSKETSALVYTLILFLVMFLIFTISAGWGTLKERTIESFEMLRDFFAILFGMGFVLWLIGYLLR